MSDHFTTLRSKGLTVRFVIFMSHISYEKITYGNLIFKFSLQWTVIKTFLIHLKGLWYSMLNYLLQIFRCKLILKGYKMPESILSETNVSLYWNNIRTFCCHNYCAFHFLEDSYINFSFQKKGHCVVNQIMNVMFRNIAQEIQQ